MMGQKQQQGNDIVLILRLCVSKENRSDFDIVSYCLNNSMPKGLRFFFKNGMSFVQAERSSNYFESREFSDNGGST